MIYVTTTLSSLRTSDKNGSIFSVNNTICESPSPEEAVIETINNFNNIKKPGAVMLAEPQLFPLETVGDLDSVTLVKTPMGDGKIKITLEWIQ